MDKYVGKRLDGRYEIQEVIGVGGMADVYKAYDSIDDRVVAVKILKDEYLPTTRSSAAGSKTNPRRSRCCPIPISSRCTMSALASGCSISSWSTSTASPSRSISSSREIIKLEGSGSFHRADPAGAAACARQGDRPPGHQAAEYHAAAGRHHQGHRLRHRPFLPQRDTATITDKAIGSVHYISPEQAARGRAPMKKPISTRSASCCTRC